MIHPHCTAAEEAAASLRAALTTLRALAVHPWKVDADLYEVDIIIAHLSAHSAELHVKEPTS